MRLRGGGGGGGGGGGRASAAAFGRVPAALAARYAAVAVAVVVAVAAGWALVRRGEQMEAVGGGADGVVVLTYVDDPAKGRFCTMLRSAESLGVPLRVLGLERGAQARDDGEAAPRPRYHFLGSKLEALASALERLPPDQLVVFVDSMDVVFQRGLDDAVAAYRAMGLAQGTVLFAGESSCYPLDLRGRYGPARDGDLHRFLNAGGWIGPAGEAGRVMRAAMEERAGDPAWDAIRIAPGSPAHLHRDDQAAVSLVYLEGRHAVAIDTRMRVFVCLHHALYRVKPTAPDNLLRHDALSHLPAPAIVHFNGEAKRSGILTVDEAVALMPWSAAPWPRPLSRLLVRLEGPAGASASGRGASSSSSTAPQSARDELAAACHLPP